MQKYKDSWFFSSKKNRKKKYIDKKPLSLSHA